MPTPRYTVPRCWVPHYLSCACDPLLPCQKMRPALASRPTRRASPTAACRSMWRTMSGSPSARSMAASDRVAASLWVAERVRVDIVDSRSGSVRRRPSRTRSSRLRPGGKQPTRRESFPARVWEVPYPSHRDTRFYDHFSRSSVLADLYGTFIHCYHPPSSQPASAERRRLAGDNSAARRRRSATPLQRG